MYRKYLFLLYKPLKKYSPHDTIPSRYRPSRSEQPESDSIGQAQDRTLTAIRSKFLYLYFDFFKRVQSSLLLFTKIHLISLFFCELLVQNLFFLFAHFYLVKKAARILRKPSLETIWEQHPNRHPNIKSIVPAFFRDR